MTAEIKAPIGRTHRSAWDTIDNKLNRVELRDTPDGAGWWIVEYANPIALTQGFASEVVGPFETQAQAIRILNSTAAPPAAGVRLDLANPPVSLHPLAGADL